MVVYSMKKFPPLKSLMPFIVQSCTRRRAMVNKIWCRKVAREWLKEKSEAPHPRIFSQPRCQDYAGAWYLIYRSIILLAWLSIIVCSIFEFGSKEPLGQIDKWPIYLTNWDLLIGAAQASLGLWLVRRRRKTQKSIDFEETAMVHGKIEKSYWFLYTSTCVIAIGVSVSYWCAVHDPKIHNIDALNIMLHVINSLLMIIDIFVTGIPLRMRHFWWPLAIVKAYLLFTVVYYLSGGLDKRGHPYIYKVLNWQNPGLSSLVCLGGLTFLIVVHSILCLCTRLRERKTKNSEKYNYDDTNTNSEQSPGTIKHVDIV